MDRLQFVICNGSLSERLRWYLAQAGYPVGKADRRGYAGCSADGSIAFWERDRRMVPSVVAQRFDAGITGLDLVLNSGVTGLRSVTELRFSRTSDRPTRWVLAGKTTTDVSRRLRIGCELPNLPALLLPRASPSISDYSVVTLEGNEEMAIDDGLCDLVLVVSETGRTLTDLGLVILPGCEELLVSMPQVIAKPQLSPAKEQALQELCFALGAAVGASAQVMMSFDIAEAVLPTLALPAVVAPTVSPLTKQGWCAVQICIPRSEIGPVGYRAVVAGARSVVVQDVVAYADRARSVRSFVGASKDESPDVFEERQRDPRLAP